ncbi:hypothetical protein CYMTET_43706 [Cymbomonas tetramitiformis]|uniref:HAT C-terminal dimerisation domain-containing protein n=1 Tax=Cymbomonas tetramitiformis TaxID=36881 RepID=A0AAE0C1M6_9CHLO|nr:hypothetical protein CYMTET_43706 [Cymbomonas tetramitiformis]
MQDCKLEDFAVATLLDPRYKSFKFKFSERWMRGQLTLKQVESWATNIFVKDWKPASTEDASEEAAAAKMQKAREASQTSFLDDSDEECEPESVVLEDTPVLNELQSYLSLPDAKADINVQQWWRKHIADFPTLEKMARQFLGVPASTAGVERAFSAVTFMHSDLRKRLAEGTIQHSLMVAMN